MDLGFIDFFGGMAMTNRTEFPVIQNAPPAVRASALCATLTHPNSDPEPAAE
jgi:hypothetical protein